MTTTSSVDTSNAGTTSDVIDAYLHSSPVTGSPIHTQSCPPGAIDLELEVGDHEVDTAFRSPDSDPLIVATSPNKVLPVSQSSTMQQLGVNPVPNTYGNGSYIYGTLGRQQPRQRPLSSTAEIPLGGRPRSQRMGSDASSSIILNPISGPGMSDLFPRPKDIDSSSQSSCSNIPQFNFNTLPHSGAMWTQPTSTRPSRGDSPMTSELHQHIMTTSLYTPSSSGTPPLSNVDFSGPLPPAMHPDPQIMRFSTIGRPGRLHNYQHNCQHQPNMAPMVNEMLTPGYGPDPNLVMHPSFYPHPHFGPQHVGHSGGSVSPVRSVVIVAPGDPSPPLPPHPLDGSKSPDCDALVMPPSRESSQMSADPKGTSSGTFYGWHQEKALRPILKRSHSLCSCHRPAPKAPGSVGFATPEVDQIVHDYSNDDNTEDDEETTEPSKSDNSSDPSINPSDKLEPPVNDYMDDMIIYDTQL